MEKIERAGEQPASAPARECLPSLQMPVRASECCADRLSRISLSSCRRSSGGLRFQPESRRRLFQVRVVDPGSRSIGQVPDPVDDLH